MPKILVEQSFPFAENGNHVIQIGVGEQEVSDRCALVAVEHLGVATYADAEPDPFKMKLPDLKEWLTANGISFDAAAKKDELLALVPEND